MFDIDLRRIIISFALVGAVVGGVTVGLALLALPWLWAIVKPMLHAWTA